MSIPFSYSTPQSASQAFSAADLNNAALQLERSGNYEAAEKKHLEALALKVKSTGESSIQVALTKNSLGELYLKMGKLGEAEQMLNDADAIRSPKNDFDAACTRDNLGQLWEMKGDVGKAREMREKGAPNSMICSNFNCPRSSQCQFSKKTDLKTCAKCKCAFYCGAMCQKADWKERHKKFCKHA